MLTPYPATLRGLGEAYESRMAHEAERSDSHGPGTSGYAALHEHC